MSVRFLWWSNVKWPKLVFGGEVTVDRAES